MNKFKINCLIMSVIMFTSLSLGTIATNVGTVVAKAATTTTTVSNMPSNFKASVQWVWANRMVKEASTARANTIFDQIYDGNGTLNYVVRWQSNKSITLQQRKDMAAMISRQINNWTKHLIGYDGWPYDNITVNVVGWACANPSLILNKQSNEIVYTDYINDDLNQSQSSIPAKLPIAPISLSRADHFEDNNYSYPGGLSKRFDMYLWGTSGFQGGAGGDWGQRISDDYILSTVNSNEAHIIEHEIGHGFGITDFYEDADRPPTGFPTPTIMWAGDSQTITDWDAWMLRYTWTQIKTDTSRFPKTNSPKTEVTVSNGSTYRLKNLNSGLYMDVENGTDVDNANIRQWYKNGATAQKFKAVNMGNGYYQLISQVGTAQKSLDVATNKATNGMNIALYTDKDSTNQIFYLKSLGNGTYALLTKCSKNASCVEVVNASTEAGANVQQWTYTGANSQKWVFELV